MELKMPSIGPPVSGFTDDITCNTFIAGRPIHAIKNMSRLHDYVLSYSSNSCARTKWHFARYKLAAQIEIRHAVYQLQDH